MICDYLVDSLTQVRAGLARVLDELFVLVGFDYFLGPTVFGDVDPETEIAREEIFGPVMGLMPVEDIDEAIDDEPERLR